MARQKTEPADLTSLFVRLPKPLHEKITAYAKKERRSLNAQFLCVLEDWLQEREEKKTHGLVGS